MSKVFTNILVPVGFSDSADLALAKAIEFSAPETVVHLLHVDENFPFRIYAGSYKSILGIDVEFKHEPVEDKLKRYKTILKEKGNINQVFLWTSQDHSIQAGIVRKSSQLKPDLIIISKTSHHSWFGFLNKVHSAKVAEKTGVPVLTVKPGSRNQKTKKVIVPISDGDTTQKLDILVVLGKKYRFNLFLVAFNNDSHSVNIHPPALMHIYQQMTEKFHLRVEYMQIRGPYKGIEILRLAEKINADVILVNAKEETKIGWSNREISDVLLPESKIQVLAVRPAN